MIKKSFELLDKIETLEKDKGRLEADLEASKTGATGVSEELAKLKIALQEISEAKCASEKELSRVVENLAVVESDKNSAVDKALNLEVQLSEFSSAIAQARTSEQSLKEKLEMAKYDV